MFSERIRERLATKREIFWALILFLVALLSGIVLNLYQVTAQKVPLYTLLFSFVGLLIGVRLGWYAATLLRDLQELEEEIEC
ncbi:MAG: hypothetical protein C6I00_06955 [Nitratiruptor sp.]|nr:hypothetical protein [Nitratiruptor sp.]